MSDTEVTTPKTETDGTPPQSGTDVIQSLGKMISSFAEGDMTAAQEILPALKADAASDQDKVKVSLNLAYVSSSDGGAKEITIAAQLDGGDLSLDGKDVQIPAAACAGACDTATNLLQNAAKRLDDMMKVCVTNVDQALQFMNADPSKATEYGNVITQAGNAMNGALTDFGQVTSSAQTLINDFCSSPGEPNEHPEAENESTGQPGNNGN